METDPLLNTFASEKLYHSLSILGSNNIRVLDLLPGSYIGKLRARLRTVPLTSKSEYVALSYTWGESTRDRKILLNDGLSVNITDNLFQALRRQRSLFTVRTLWVDALCINQADAAERSQQVPRMRLIYRHATFVDIWLGEPGLVSPISLSTLHCILWRIKTNELRECWYLLSNAFSIHPEAMEKAIVNSTPRWHERVWVAQEYILATKTHFSFGNRRINEGMVDSISEIAHGNAERFKHLNAFANRVGSWRRIGWQKRLTAKDPEVFNANTFAEQGTTAVANCSSTDPRDRVYGMLGCIRREEAALIPANYNLSCWQVFARATAACMILDQSHRILRLVSISPRRTEGLPSWAVDFESVGRMLLEEASVVYTPSLQVSGMARGTYLEYSDTSMNALRVRGFKCGTVVKVVLLGSDLSDHRRSAMRLSSDMESGPTSENASRDSETCDSDLSSIESRRQNNEITNCESFLITQLPPAAEEPTLQQAKSFLRSLKHPGKQYLPARDHDNHRFLYQAEVSFQHWIASILGATDNLNVLGNADPAWWTPNNLETIYEYIVYAVAASQGSCLFWTAGGLVGLAPMSVRVGDEIVLTQGQKFPFLLLREISDHYLFRGLPFMHGLDLNVFRRDEADTDLATRFGVLEELEVFEIR